MPDAKRSAWRLGAGRARKEDSVSEGAGIEIHAKPGDAVTAGMPLLTLHTDDDRRFSTAMQALEGAVVVGATGASANRLPLILERIN